jgi:hypothetical protein
VPRLNVDGGRSRRIGASFWVLGSRFWVRRAQKRRTGDPEPRTWKGPFLRSAFGVQAHGERGTENAERSYLRQPSPPSEQLPQLVDAVTHHADSAGAAVERTRAQLRHCLRLAPVRDHERPAGAPLPDYDGVPGRFMRVSIDPALAAGSHLRAVLHAAPQAGRGSMVAIAGQPPSARALH